MSLNTHPMGLIVKTLLKPKTSCIIRSSKLIDMEEGITKLCIINHNTHEVYIETVDNHELDTVYGGEEERLIKDKYEITDEQLKNGEFTWDWFVNITAYGVVESELDELNVY